jgi:hypothetical protein
MPPGQAGRGGLGRGTGGSLPPISRPKMGASAYQKWLIPPMEFLYWPGILATSAIVGLLLVGAGGGPTPWLLRWWKEPPEAEQASCSAVHPIRRGARMLPLVWRSCALARMRSVPVHGNTLRCDVCPALI